jgi:hypothetical protein
VLPNAGGLSQNVGVDFSYFTGSDGFAAPMCPGCEGGPSWLAGLASVPDVNGNDILYAGYAIVNADGSSKESGLARFDDEKQHFERVITDFAKREDFVRPDAHDFTYRHGDTSYVYYGDRLRIPASAEAFMNPAQYEQFGPYAANASKEVLIRADGTLDYAWRPGARHVSSAQLKAAGIHPSQDLDGKHLDIETGKPISVTPPAIVWNAYRQRFFQVMQQIGGSSSAIGEIWHAEADTPLGPWVYARHIITHDRYTFYNTFHHPEFAQGQFSFIEGTYTATYSGNEDLTPRYNYNQLLYRLDLEDARLFLPVAVYDLDADLPGKFATKRKLRAGMTVRAAAFFAPDRPLQGTLPVAWAEPSCAPGPRRLTIGNVAPTAPLFYALPATSGVTPPNGVALYEFSHADGRYAYGLETTRVPQGFVRSSKPMAIVWKNPISVALPVVDYLGDLVANAGADQCITSSGPTSAVVLDASASVVRSSNAKYTWHVAGRDCSIQGQRITLDLASGVHRIELRVTDDAGNHSQDSVNVLIQPKP